VSIRKHLGSCTRGFIVIAATTCALTSLSGTANAVPGVPSQIVGVTVSSAVSTLVVRASAPNSNGTGITKYVATCIGAGKRFTASNLTLPVAIHNVPNNVLYSCEVHAENRVGAGPDSYVAPGVAGGAWVKTTYTYCTRTGHPLLMDVYRPKGQGIVPVVMYVHGGGWNAGNRLLGASLLPTLLTSRGFALASVDYRLAPSANPTQQTGDIACAVRYLRAHATALKIRAAKIGGIGSSAGGNLISLLGVNPPALTPTDQWPGQSEKIQAVVDQFGITEFGRDQMAITPLLYVYWNTHDQSVLDSYAPVKYVTTGDAPFLIVHGELDAVAPVHEGRDFYNLLQAAHVPSQFIPIAHTGHEFAAVDGNPSPAMVTVYSDEILFLNSRLK
jgi:acetyl esterase/lipase